MLHSFLLGVLPYIHYYTSRASQKLALQVTEALLLYGRSILLQPRRAHPCSWSQLGHASDCAFSGAEVRNVLFATAKLISDDSWS